MDHDSAPLATSPHGQPKLIRQLRDALRLRPYSLKTEKAYTHWETGALDSGPRRIPRINNDSMLQRSVCRNGGRFDVHGLWPRRATAVMVQ